MAQRFQLEYDDFGGGLNLRYAAHLIAKNEAQVANNVDLQDRAIKGLKDWSSSVSSAGSAYQWLWYGPAASWLTGAYVSETRYAMNDGSKVYSTRNSQRPAVVTPSASYSLGISPPEGITWEIDTTGTSKSGVYKYAFTFVTADGLESNPQDFDLTLSLMTTLLVPAPADVKFYNIPVSSDPRVVARNVYRSLSNSDAMYFLATIPDNSSTYTSISPWLDNLPDSALDLTRPLTWNDGGYPNSGGVYVEDHSVPPTLSVLSTGLHSASGGGAGRSGSGIVFGAQGSTVYWSMLGFPDYWPTVNQFAVAENVESIVALGGSTFVFTPNFIYQARGDSDDTMSWSRSNTPYGVKKGFGRFTTPTTKGILFFGQDGLAVFDGSDARLVAEQKLPRTYYNSRTINAVGFFDNRFYVFCADGTVIYDFRDGITNPVITTSSHIASAATVANYSEPVTADVLAPLPSVVSSVAISNPGSYFSAASYQPGTAPASITSITATVAAPTVGTTATVSLRFGIDRVAVASGGGGSSFNSVPTVTFKAPSGQGRVAKGVAAVAGGKLLSITVTDSGAGYTADDLGDANLIQLSTGSTGASAPFLDVYVKITDTQVTNPGTGYTSSPKITISASGSGNVKVAGQLFADVEPIRYEDAALTYILSGGVTYLFRMGGVSISSPNPSSTTVNTVDQYDTTTKSWGRASATITGGAVRGIAAASGSLFGGVAFIAGGASSASSVAATSSNFLQWDGTSFSGLAAMPSARSFGTLSRVSGVSYYIGGYDSSSQIKSTVYKYSSGSWSTVAGGLVANGVTYRLTQHVAIPVNGVIYMFGGVVELSSNPGVNILNPYVLAWNTSNDTLTVDSSGIAQGWTGRQRLQAATDGSLIYLYGGVASLSSSDITSTLSDLWIYDPSDLSSKWKCRTGEVINAYARCRAGYAYDETNKILYTVGGSTTYSRYTADALAIPLAQAADCSGTAGLYVLASSDSTIRRFEGGSRMSDWTWQGRDEVGPKPGPKMTWVRARASVVDSVKIGATVYEGTGGAQTWPTFATSAVGTALGSQVRFWFPSVQASPSNMVVRGQRISLKLGAANSSTTAEVHRVEIDAKMDTDGQG